MRIVPKKGGASNANPKQRATHSREERTHAKEVGGEHKGRRANEAWGGTQRSALFKEG